MRYVQKKSKLIVLILLMMIPLHFGNMNATANEDPMTIGNEFFALENYDAAITEYKRFLFFHGDDTQAAETYHRIGLAYRAQGLWQNAIVAMRNAMLQASTLKEKSEYQLDLAVILIAAKNYDLARLELIKVMLRNADVQQTRRSYFLQAVANIYQYRWEEAREATKNYTEDEILDKLFDEAENLQQKNKLLAKVLSAVIPGTGQIYAGKWRSGINALILNGVLGYVAVDTVLEGKYIDAALWSYFIFQRYYRGNLYRAGKAVEEFNEDSSHQAAEKILNRLQEIAENP